MAKGKNSIFILFAILIIAGIVLYSAGGGQFQQSIVSLSSVQFDDGTNYWITTLTVNSNDKLTFAKGSTDALPNGSTATTGSTIDVQLSPMQPSCQYPLQFREDRKTVLFYFLPQTFVFKSLEFGSSTVESQYKVRMSKNNSFLDEKIVNGLTPTTISLANSGVQLTTNGVMSGLSTTNCPSADSAILIPKYASDGVTITGYNLKSKTDYVAYIDKINLFTFANPFELLDRIVNTTEIRQPSGWTTSNWSNVSQVTSLGQGTKLIYNIPASSSNVSVTLKISKALADTVIYTPQKAMPQLTLTGQKGIDQSESFTLTASVKNVGEGAGTFDLLPTGTGKVIITPPSNRITDLAAGATSTKTFLVYGQKVGAENLCVQAVSTTDPSKATTRCVNFSVTATERLPEELPDGKVDAIIPPPINPVCGNLVCEVNETVVNCFVDCSPITPQPCGNAVCELGENNVNCPNDCKEEIIEPTCEWYEVNKETQTAEYGALPAFGAMLLNWGFNIKVGVINECVINPLLIIGVFAVIIIAIVAILMMPKKRGRRGR